MSNTEAFTPAEQAYFDSRGETPIEKEADTSEAVENETVEEEDAGEEESGESSKEEAKEEATKDDSEKPKKDQRVPLRKLRTAEERYKTAEREAADLREKFARADERLRLLTEVGQRQEAEKAPTPPDPVVDPIGAIEWQRQQTEALKQEHERQVALQREDAVIRQIDEGYKRSWGAFASEKPDAMEAYKHFTGSLAAYFEMQGAPADRIDELVVQEERRLAYQAAQRRQNPAEIVYNMAQRFGYQPKLNESVEDEAAKKAEEDIERRQKGVKAGKSLSDASGSRAGKAPTAVELATMSDEEFSEVMAKMSDRERRKIMGG